MSSLDKLEKECRVTLIQSARTRTQLSPLKFFGITVFFTPFTLLAAMFTPAIGAALATASTVLTFYYLFLKRDLKLAVSYFLGVAAISSALSLITGYFKGEIHLFLYIFLGLGIFVSIVYLTLISVLIFWHYEDTSSQATP